MKAISCKNCDFCKRLYEKSQYSFIKSDKYYCKIEEKLTELNKFCVKWQPQGREFDLSAQRFDKIEEDIKSIIEYLNNG